METQAVAGPKRGLVYLRQWRESRPPEWHEREAQRLAKSWKERMSNPVKRASKLAAKKVWGKANPIKIRKYNKTQYVKNNHLWLRARLKKYGLTVAEFNALLALQSNKCAVCLNDFTGGKDTHIDHDHSTGRVRGLLCGCCNRGIGQFRDSSERLAAAAAYLKREEYGNTSTGVR